MRKRVLTSQLWVPNARQDIFEFFSDINNLDSITPPWLHFRILTPAVKAGKGALLEYRLRLHGVPVRWLTEITVWEPPSLFVDEQREGPYKKWVHEHRFLQDGTGTLVLDRVEFQVPGWIFEPWLYHLFVGPDLEKVFEFRRGWLRNYFQTSGERPCPET